ncbi:translation initiation factor eIF4e [Meredithblackwellia eburnea MCA 4105]
MAVPIVTKPGSVSTLVDHFSTLERNARSPTPSPNSSPTLNRSASNGSGNGNARAPSSPSPSSNLNLSPAPTFPASPTLPVNSTSESSQPTTDDSSSKDTLPEQATNAPPPATTTDNASTNENANDHASNSDQHDSIERERATATPLQTPQSDDLPTTPSKLIQESNDMLPTPPPSASSTPASIPASAPAETPSTPSVAIASTSDSPITQILKLLPSLEAKERATIQKNLERLGEYPRELPLSCSWTMFFSDTSRATKTTATTEAQYTDSQSRLFNCSTVPSLCGSLKAYKKLVAAKSKKGSQTGDSMGLLNFRAGQNLHFFREGITPTWEDPWNEKGGRLTITPPLVQLDSIYERLVLLLAGSALESGVSDLLKAQPNPNPNPKGAGKEGLIMGVVASRRARGDRIELWLGGREKKEPTPMEWVDRLKECLSEELGMPELKTGKFKKHFS